jgi:hypothetical protein
MSWTTHVPLLGYAKPPHLQHDPEVRGAPMVAKSGIQKVFANAQGEVTIVCPHCHNAKAINIAKYRTSPTLLRAKCSCGYVIDINDICLNLRKYYRKKVNLKGSYLKVKEGERGIMIVKDLSYSGLRFKTEKEDDIKVDDILGVKFILNDDKRVEINRSTIVKNKKGRYVGAEFCDTQAYDMELMHYLLLS